jgi:hypothetical protein
MCRILRWVGYVSTAIGAILIIMAIIGGFRFHHHFMHEHMQTTCTMQHHDNEMTGAKADSGKCKQHEMMGKDTTKCCKKAMMGKGCCKKQAMMCSPMAAPMMCQGCQMFHHRIAFHMGLAICFLLLAIALFMICKHCHCKHCCECKDGKCECKEEKKE